MKLPRKSRPDLDSAMTALKRLPADDRADILAWRSDPALTTAAARQLIAEKYGLQLNQDSQLRRFWKWQLGQATIDTLVEIKEWDQDQLQQRFPNLTRDQIRDAIIKRSYAIADMTEDVALSLRAARSEPPAGKFLAPTGRRAFVLNNPRDRSLAG